MIPTSVATATFCGFQPRLLDFLSQLRDHNSREWFHDHRAEYEELFLEPARQFVSAMAELFPRLAADIHAEPRVYGSIFAITRDTRFSADKSPYKTYLDLWFWQGDGPSRERPGYFFRLSPEQLTLGAGMHSFAAEGVLERYRRAVLDDVRGQELQSVAEAVGEDGVQGRTYKRVPSGLPSDHARAAWLRHSGLFVQVEQPVPEQLFAAFAAEWCFDRWKLFQPLQQWLADLLCN